MGSNKSGRNELHVRPFDASSGTASAEETWQVSEDFASQAFWRQDGQELFYLALVDRETGEVKVMAVDVTTTPEFQVGTPRLLFQVRPSGNGRPWMHVRPDGQRFVFLMPAGGP